MIDIKNISAVQNCFKQETILSIQFTYFKLKKKYPKVEQPVII